MMRLTRARGYISVISSIHNRPYGCMQVVGAEAQPISVNQVRMSGQL
jgi:hypothetical protein